MELSFLPHHWFQNIIYFDSWFVLLELLDNKSFYHYPDFLYAYLLHWSDGFHKYCNNTILMADSGYESFNTFAPLVRKRMYFVIRMKDINSNGILSAYDLPDSKFDTHIRTTLTRRHTKETLGNHNTYTILQPSTDFDFLDENCMYYDIEFRIVRIRLDNGTYICIATNLSEEEFPLEEINKLYRMRWSEETSFRELKYTIGLINWHSSKYDGILQEINAHMILYNFCELVTSHAVVKTSKNNQTRL